MKIINRKTHTIDFIFPIVLFFTFAILALMIMLFAADSYEDKAKTSVRNNSCSTAVLYVTEKIHANDSKGCISVGSFDGCQALIIKDNSEKGYVTYIYSADGALKELYAKSGSGATAASGIDIVDLKDFSISKSDGIIHIQCTGNDGTTEKSNVLYRCD